MDEIQKPITIARAEFVSDMTSLINNSGLPPLLLNQS